jgi:hypothetical protein
VVVCVFQGGEEAVVVDVLEWLMMVAGRTFVPMGWEGLVVSPFL